MNKAMKDRPIGVCFIAPKAYPLFNPAVKSVFGGAEVDLYYLACELARDSSFNVSFIVADYGQSTVETIEGVTIIKSLAFRQNPFLSALKIWQAMKKADADIYMLKTASAGVLLAMLFCKLHGKIFAYRTAHRTECDGTYIRKHFLSGRTFAGSIRRAALVFVQNADDCILLKKTIGVDGIVIPNGHRLTDIAGGEKTSTLWAGRSAEFKRPEKFLSLAEKFPDEKFVMICQKAAGGNNFDRLQLAAKPPNLEFIDYVAFKDIEKYFLDAKVLINTSTAEGFANTFIQAAMAGAAILTLTVNPDGFLDRFSCGICCNGDEGKLIENLRFLLEQNRYIEYGANGRKYVRQNHDVAEIAESYKAIFKRIITDRLCRCAE